MSDAVKPKIKVKEFPFAGRVLCPGQQAQPRPKRVPQQEKQPMLTLEKKGAAPNGDQLQTGQTEYDQMHSDSERPHWRLHSLSMWETCVPDERSISIGWLSA